MHICIKIPFIFLIFWEKARKIMLAPGSLYTHWQIWEIIICNCSDINSILNSYHTTTAVWNNGGLLKEPPQGEGYIVWYEHPDVPYQWSIALYQWCLCSNSQIQSNTVEVWTIFCGYFVANDSTLLVVYMVSFVSSKSDQYMPRYFMYTRNAQDIYPWWQFQC